MTKSTQILSNANGLILPVTIYACFHKQQLLFKLAPLVARIPPSSHKISTFHHSTFKPFP